MEQMSDWYCSTMRPKASRLPDRLCDTSSVSFSSIHDPLAIDNISPHKRYKTSNGDRKHSRRRRLPNTKRPGQERPVLLWLSTFNFQLSTVLLRLSTLNSE